MGYRYFDSFGVAPAFPFGFGLSYTEFALRCHGVAASGSIVTVQAAVTNVGETYSGKEVAQPYVSAPSGGLHKEYQSLAAFAKTAALAPGGSQTLELVFDLKNIARYRESDDCYVLEPGAYIPRLGSSSRNTVTVGVLTLDSEIIVSRHEHICPPAEPLEELRPAARGQETLPADIPRVAVDTSAFETAVCRYETAAVCGDPGSGAFWTP